MMWIFWLLLFGPLVVLGLCYLFGRGAEYGYRLGLEDGRKAADAEWALHLEHGAL